MNEKQSSLNLLTITREFFFFNKKTFTRNTSWHYRKFNGQNNQNFDGGKGKTSIVQQVEHIW